MMQRKTNPEISGILSLLLNRFDRLEKQIASVGRDNLGGDELLDSRDIRILTKMSDRTILRRRNDGTTVLQARRQNLLPQVRRSESHSAISCKVVDDEKDDNHRAE